jgi:hypothetical protein
MLEPAGTSVSDSWDSKCGPGGYNDDGKAGLVYNWPPCSALNRWPPVLARA